MIHFYQKAIRQDALCEYLDVAAIVVYAAVRAERADQPIQSLPTFTRDLHALADG